MLTVRAGGRRIRDRRKVAACQRLACLWVRSYETAPIHRRVNSISLGLSWRVGSIQPEAPIGTCFIPTSCIREEGTSLHYLSSDEGLRPSQRLVRALEKARVKRGIVAYTGPIWTTDAPYRETVTTIEKYRLRNVLGVDMETSAMYALGVYRNVEVCNLLVVSDELWKDWKPAFGRPELRLAMKQAGEAVLDVIRTLRASAS